MWTEILQTNMLQQYNQYDIIIQLNDNPQCMRWREICIYFKSRDSQKIYIEIVFLWWAVAHGAMSSIIIIIIGIDSTSLYCNYTCKYLYIKVY